jgi:hypothetical protein
MALRKRRDGAALTCERSSRSHRAEISGLDVVEGSVRIYGESVFGKPGQRWPSASTMTRCWSPSLAWHRHCACACVRLGGAGRDLRYAGGQGWNGVVMGCDERLARSAVVQIGIADGHVEMLGFTGGQYVLPTGERRRGSVGRCR